MMLLELKLTGKTGRWQCGPPTQMNVVKNSQYHEYNAGQVKMQLKRDHEVKIRNKTTLTTVLQFL